MNIYQLLTFLLSSIISLSSSAQIVFDNDSFSDNSVDRTGFDYSIKAYLTNNSANADDTFFNWNVISLNQPSY